MTDAVSKTGAKAAPSGPIARTDKTRLRRRHQNASYDRDVVHGILDAGLICHVGFVVDGQPFVVPTAYWRMGESIFWHGSSASRMLKQVAKGIPVCITVSHVDGIVHARSGFNSCMNYRSVMMFGTSYPITDTQQKAMRLDGLLDRLADGRSRDSRPSSKQELKATSVMRLDLVEVSAKVRCGDVGDSEEDLALPHWAGIVPIKMVAGEPIDDPELRSGIARPDYITRFELG